MSAAGCYSPLTGFSLNIRLSAGSFSDFSRSYNHIAAIEIIVDIVSDKSCLKAAFSAYSLVLGTVYVQVLWENKLNAPYRYVTAGIACMGGNCHTPIEFIPFRAANQLILIYEKGTASVTACAEYCETACVCEVRFKPGYLPREVLHKKQKKNRRETAFQRNFAGLFSLA